jgi:hypothetical protein
VSVVISVVATAVVATIVRLQPAVTVVATAVVVTMVRLQPAMADEQLLLLVLHL